MIQGLPAPRGGLMRALTCLLVVVLMACGGGSSPSGPPPPPPPEQGTVTGSVVEDGSDGVPGASVALTRPSFTTRNATTNAAGSYTFTSVEVGSWTVTVTPTQGFEAVGSLTASVQVTANQTTTVAPVVLARVAEPPGGEPVVVQISDNVFTPVELSISAPRTVRWVNGGPSPHNTTSRTNAWSSGTLNSGQVFEHQFTQAGTFQYDCTLHPGMTGTIVVQ